MKTMKKLLPVAIALSAAAAPAMAEISANIGASSDYLWRGISLSGDDTTVSGGVDWAGDIGLYAGVWVSSLGGNGSGSETDFYGGFAMDLGDNMNIDVGYIQYSYLDSGGQSGNGNGYGDYGEVYANFTLAFATVGVAYTAWADDINDGGAYDEGDIYVFAAVDFDLGNDWSIGATAGYTEFDNDGSNGNGDLNYGHGQIDLTKSAGDFGDFTLTASAAQEDAEGVTGRTNTDLVKTVVSWSKTF